ncbi:Map microtubule affinity-regulating kinase [Linnemannia gamsii]|uniref:Map microtubule affinity-regulating kinase n=1 Tax=Linnemannia gamsii TaxID=64522 RepID=A0A9P6UT09_9FUNG|nr:Map microtubule affinity-regulating kinase [Linnemannia gamsii]
MSLYAVKVIDKQAHKADILLRLRREIDLMESLDHPNIVKLHEVIETQFTIYVCMEYVEGCSLEEHLKTQDFSRIGEKDARKITRELAGAISHCHSRLVAHRDIKPANILLTTSGKVMLIDFGLGNTFSPRSRLNTICGSLPYYSPEIARGSTYMGPEVDIWCLGVVLYRMTVGRDPFIGATKREVKLQITQGALQVPSSLSPELRATLTKLLAPESSQRRHLSILENDAWLHMDSTPPFLAEDRRLTDTSRLSGATLVRHPSKATTTTGATAWKRLSMTDSYYHGKTGSLFGSRSLMMDTIGAGVWQLDKNQPRFHKSRVRIVPCKETSGRDLLFQKDIDLSLLQFLMPIIRSCHVSYYLHSTSRILCGISFVKDSSFAASLDQFHHQPSMVLQKIVQHVGAAMTGGGSGASASAFHHSSSAMGSGVQGKNTRCGVFSIDIVKAKGRTGERGGRVLIIKRLFGSASTVQHFKKLFTQHATGTAPSSSPSSPRDSGVN